MLGQRTRKRLKIEAFVGCCFSKWKKFLLNSVANDSRMIWQFMLDATFYSLTILIRRKIAVSVSKTNTCFCSKLNRINYMSLTQLWPNMPAWIKKSQYEITIPKINLEKVMELIQVIMFVTGHLLDAWIDVSQSQLMLPVTIL